MVVVVVVGTLRVARHFIHNHLKNHLLQVAIRGEALQALWMQRQGGASKVSREPWSVATSTPVP